MLRIDRGIPVPRHGSEVNGEIATHRFARGSAPLFCVGEPFEHSNGIVASVYFGERCVIYQCRFDDDEDE